MTLTHELRVRARDGVDGVVGVQRLRDFAGTDLDSGRRAELVVVEDLVEHGEDQRVGRGTVERAGLGEQRVDPPGPAALEVVPSERRRGEDRGRLGSSPGQALGVEEPLDQGVTVVGEPGAHGLALCLAFGRGAERGG